MNDDTRERLATLGEIAAQAAHELRSVLQTISSSAFVARLAADRGDAAAALPHLARLERSARVAHTIVDDVLSLARGIVTREEVAVASLVANARAELAADCARWDDRIVPDDLVVRAHPGLFTRLLHVLYENAVAASAPRPPTITTRARVEGGRHVIEVADDGPGVPASLAGAIFDPLVSGRAGGTGLGLSLARRIVEAHGGAIGLVATSDAGAAPGGATFRIEIDV